MSRSHRCLRLPTQEVSVPDRRKRDLQLCLGKELVSSIHTCCAGPTALSLLFSRCHIHRSLGCTLDFLAVRLTAEEHLVHRASAAFSRCVKPWNTWLWTEERRFQVCTGSCTSQIALSQGSMMLVLFRTFSPKINLVSVSAGLYLVPESR